MQVVVGQNLQEISREAAGKAAGILRRKLAEQDSVVVVAATGASQLAFLQYLVGMPGLDWKRVELFHLDEYAGVGIDHPASFARYMRDRLVVPAGIQKYHLLDGSSEPSAVATAMSAEIGSRHIDASFVGIGENGHLAFNDPPADFECETPYIVVELDEACRLQQVGEGWFSGIDAVPERAITMTIRQIMRAEELLCLAPQRRKAEAVQKTVEGPVSPDVPASILQRHPQATLFLDRDSASLLAHGGEQRAS